MQVDVLTFKANSKGKLIATWETPKHFVGVNNLEFDMCFWEDLERGKTETFKRQVLPIIIENKAKYFKWGKFTYATPLKFLNE